MWVWQFSFNNLVIELMHYTVHWAEADLVIFNYVPFLRHNIYSLKVNDIFSTSKLFDIF